MSRNTTAAFRAYARSQVLKSAFLVEAEFTSVAINLWTGYGDLVVDGKTYTGAGNLLNIDSSSESLEMRANGFTVTLSGMDSSILSIALQEPYTGRPITVKTAFLVPEPEVATTFKVTASGGKYYIEDLLTPDLDIYAGNKYIFDVSDSSNSGHQFRLSTTVNGTGGGGSQYTSASWTESGTSGTAGATATWVAPATFPSYLYYYCTNHTGMGGSLINNPSIVVADPYAIFSGFMDVMTLKDSGEKATISVNCENELIILENPKINRYTPEDQSINFPNDKGLEYVASLQDQEILWGNTKRTN